MKKIFVSLFVAIAVIFASCDDDNTTLPTNAAGIVVNGTWKVTLFSENEVNQSSTFTGYNFTFNANGTVAAVKTGGTTVNGTWAKGTDDSKEKLILNFGIVSNFDELNEDWRVLEATDTKIRLEHVSGGNGTTDLLTFEKN